MSQAFDPLKHHRRSIRLQGYDYSQAGAYFVTICTHRRECYLSDIEADEANPTMFGQIAIRQWLQLPKHYPNVEIDAYVFMPNHLHGIVVLTDLPNRGSLHGLSEIMRGFKTYSARLINRARKLSGTSVWQRSFYEHIIRSETALNAIRRYITGNPQRWAEDTENPNRVAKQ